MFLHVTKAEYIGGYALHLTFNNGVSGDIDLEDELYGEMFAPLRNIEKFKEFRVDEEIDTVVWGNGADFAPEFFYDKMKSQNLKVAEESPGYKAD
ncbi:MAG: DUF2442 domain-containing protein [Verrucomicrobia bacterium]|nr:DUF2442 domain-containing protein [Verrucomicrobiota bacterium]